MKIISTQITSTKAKVQAAYTDDSIITDVAIANLPNPESQLGKSAELFIDPTTGVLSYEYADKILTENEQVLHDRLAEAEAENTSIREQLAQTNADAVGFQDFIFEKFPELA